MPLFVLTICLTFGGGFEAPNFCTFSYFLGSSLRRRKEQPVFMPMDWLVFDSVEISICCIVPSFQDSSES